MGQGFCGLERVVKDGDVVVKSKPNEGAPSNSVAASGSKFSGSFVVA